MFLENGINGEFWGGGEVTYYIFIFFRDVLGVLLCREMYDSDAGFSSMKQRSIKSFEYNIARGN